MSVSTLKDAYEVVGKPTTDNSKMGKNVLCFNTDPHECNTGSVLREKKDSVCFDCYSIALCNFRDNVRVSYKNNYDKLLDAMTRLGPSKVAKIVSFIIQKKDRQWVRDRAGGDCVSPEEFDMWNEVAHANPGVGIWKPNKEANWLRKFLRRCKDIPDNIVYRVSSPKVDQPPLKFKHTSVVYRKKKFDAVQETVSLVKCPAHEQENQCRDCKQCGDTEVSTVVYPHRPKRRRVKR